MEGLDFSVQHGATEEEEFIDTTAELAVLLVPVADLRRAEACGVRCLQVSFTVELTIGIKAHGAACGIIDGGQMHPAALLRQHRGAGVGVALALDGSGGERVADEREAHGGVVEWRVEGHDDSFDIRRQFVQACGSALE